MTNRQQIVERLQQRIDEVLRPYVPAIKELILLDFPNHGNVGDSAIYLGEIAFFRKNFGRPAAVVCNFASPPWTEIDNCHASTPIFLHGGGNFGDVWPHHQKFRESVLERYPERLVIQLPQTIHYANVEVLARTARVIEGHGNFVLLVRDEVSYQTAKDNFVCKVVKCPDMAFYLGALTRPQVATSLLLLLRTDREKNQEMVQLPSLPGNSLVADWIDDPRSMRWTAKLSTLLHGLLVGNLREMYLRQHYFELLSRRRVKRGLNLLSSGNFIVTDRLHAHILALLLDVPHMVLDNTYGKVSRFVELWTKSYSAVSQASTLTTALTSYRKTQETLP